MDEKTVDIINIAVGVLGHRVRHRRQLLAWIVVEFPQQGCAGPRAAGRPSGADRGHAQTPYRRHTTRMPRAPSGLRHCAAGGFYGHGRRRAPDGGPRTRGARRQKTMDFDRCVEVTLAQEGGFAQLANDPGGATNFGITLATLQGVARGSTTGRRSPRTDTAGGRGDLSRQLLAARPMRRPAAGVDMMVFDCGVNSGVRTSVRMLQQVGRRDRRRLFGT